MEGQGSNPGSKYGPNTAANTHNKCLHSFKQIIKEIEAIIFSSGKGKSFSPPDHS